MYYINGVCDMLQHCDCLRYFNVIYMRLISTCRKENKHSLMKKLKNTLTLERQNTYDRIKREIRHSFKRI